MKYKLNQERADVTECVFIIVFQYCNMVLSIIGSLLLIWLDVDIAKYKSEIKKDQFNGGYAMEIEQTQNDHDKTLQPSRKMSQRYIFSEGDHSQHSTLLKVAAVILGTGHLLHLGLIIATQVFSGLTNEESNFICRPGITILSNFFHILFVIVEVSRTVFII